MLLAINPFLTGAGSIALRKMTQLNQYAAAFWLNQFTILQSLFVIIYFKQNLPDMILGFTALDWLVQFANGANNII